MWWITGLSSDVNKIIKRSKPIEMKDLKNPVKREPMEFEGDHDLYGLQRKVVTACHWSDSDGCLCLYSKYPHVVGTLLDKKDCIALQLFNETSCT